MSRTTLRLLQRNRTAHREKRPHTFVPMPQHNHGLTGTKRSGGS